MTGPSEPDFFVSLMLAGLEKIKESFLPFWAARANASVQLRGARIGFDVWVHRWNPASKRSEPRIETSWQWVNLQRTFWEQRYTAEDLGMQVRCCSAPWNREHASSKTNLMGLLTMTPIHKEIHQDDSMVQKIQISETSGKQPL